MARWLYRFHSFTQALSRLQEATCSTLTSDLEKEGLCHRFEFTLELAWKVVKDYLEFAGYTFPLASPRQVLITAGQVGLLQDVEAWLEVLVLWNRLAHLYEKALSEEAIEVIRQKALPPFSRLTSKTST
ncbi:MAG: HI0074 family nucleotidyltransferase substrate-binding subunit [Bacteroidia bacterium]